MKMFLPRVFEENEEKEINILSYFEALYKRLHDRH